MKSNNGNTKYWVYLLLSLVLTLFTIFLNAKTYFGLLNLLPAIIAVFFGILSYKTSSINIPLKRTAIVIIVLAFFAGLLVLVGEFKTKQKDKVEFIDEFSRDIDQKMELSEKDSLNK